MPEMTGYQTLTFYDLHEDCDCIRISGFDGRGGEFWMKRQREITGRGKRAQLDNCLAAIRHAIELGLEPGEVVVDEADT